MENYMKVVGGEIEGGIEVGNHSDKYNSKNPIVKKLMADFDSSFQGFVDQSKCKDLHEIGCGEGIWALNWKSQGLESRGSDFSSVAIEVAKENARTAKIDCNFFKKIFTK